MLNTCIVAFKASFMCSEFLIVDIENLLLTLLRIVVRKNL